MVAGHVCDSCRGVDLSALGLPGRSEPDHCYGHSDRPAAAGVLGGYRCSCPCRGWLHATHDYGGEGSDGWPTERTHCAGRSAAAHERTPMVDGACPVCGEQDWPGDGSGMTDSDGEQGVPRADYSREELIAICERAVVPVKDWHDRDSAAAQQGVGLAWVMLRAGADFYINPPRPGRSGCHTDERTIWVDLHWPGFQAFEYDRSDHANWEHGTVYLPTPARLDESDGDDWY